MNRSLFNIVATSTLVWSLSVSAVPGVAAATGAPLAEATDVGAPKPAGRPRPKKTPSPKSNTFAKPTVEPKATATPVPTVQPTLSVSRSAKGDALPFWKRRPALMKKIRDSREVLVSVKREDVSGGPTPLVGFSMNGVGVVERSKDHCFKVAQRYEKLKDVSSHFKTVNYDPANSQVLMVAEALGYQSRMILQLTPVSEDWRSEIQWEVVWGHFKGMKGVIGFEAIDSMRTEVSLQARYEAAELPLPKVLMGFALEVVTQKVAEKMRTYMETAP